MPELPEVETTMSALQPFVEKKIVSVDINNRNLRWKIEKDFEKNISNKKIISIARRAKYIIFNLSDGFIILHLGMSGNIRIQDLKSNTYKKHDHIILYLKDKKIIYNDIRRFGSIHFTDNAKDHFLIKNLGPEPLLSDFNKKYLFNISRKSKTNIKNFIMNQKVVVGVGNIYASEALFEARINPNMITNSISEEDCKRLVKSIKNILKIAINMGGTTLKDFYSVDGSEGYFKIKLKVYGRENKKCKSCKGVIKKIVLNQRSTFYCLDCQK
uniref:Formamidopyrimidine-DNA glycosylase n=1 Tax=uncultured bacterium MedeBAC35C06 TaxID=332273 RepID=Q4PK91_9BACT|nr:predicted formamidopyrimidine-DNA glycosylase [uncultured bacterium MedeBAC35C06]